MIGRGRSGRREQAEPGDHLEVRHAGLRMVGSSGMFGERVRAVMASPRSLPSRTVGRIAPAFWNVMVTRPPITSVKTAPR